MGASGDSPDSTGLKIDKYKYSSRQHWEVPQASPFNLHFLTLVMSICLGRQPSPKSSEGNAHLWKLILIPKGRDEVVDHYLDPISLKETGGIPAF